MKTSNKILLLYGVVFAVFTFGSLGLNVHKYRENKPAIQQCFEGLRDGRGNSVLIVDSTTVVSFHHSDYGSMMLHGLGLSIAEVRVLGDTLLVRGGRYLSAPNSVKRIIKGDRIIDVPPVEAWEGGEIGF